MEIHEGGWEYGYRFVKGGWEYGYRFVKGGGNMAKGSAKVVKCKYYTPRSTYS